MRDATERTRRAAAWIALRTAAATALGVAPGVLEIARDAHGKPIVADHELEISLAHAGHLGLIGISRAGPIGVDIDQVRAVTLSGGRRAHLVALASPRLWYTSSTVVMLLPSSSCLVGRPGSLVRIRA